VLLSRSRERRRRRLLLLLLRHNGLQLLRQKLHGKQQRKLHSRRLCRMWLQGKLLKRQKQHE
jgi:hypothetical protein